ncbi:hypothetical protein CspeluHIS016_0400620 [Cutaneotrichosporon spelunceum]|uniref:Uncharacterized protein n=1 Tax=Cutaneotrichosporon spelunceum TaxID=1672016 RepID=A0AAD3TV80_9TREE|nr:hypothetical protein CspeluHIS016_0400620 [Cutaneotrichosporon spelunceum]
MSTKIPRISLGDHCEESTVLVGDMAICPSCATTSPRSSEGSVQVANDAKLVALATHLKGLEAKVDALHVKLDAIIDHLGVDRD